MALDTITTDGETNSAWRTAINGGLDLLNSDVLQAGTTLTITQSGNESTTQCVVSGHTSATFNASDYSNDAQATIQAAIDSLPKNMSGHNIDISVGTTDGQEITISNHIVIENFDGGVVTVKSAKTADNSDNGSTKANKIVSAGTTIDRILAIRKCSECNVQGLELKENTGTQSSSYVVVVSSCWSDINHCKLTGGGVLDQQRALLSQRGANVWLRDSWVDNVATGILINNSAIAAQTNCNWTGTQPITGMYAAKSIGITDSSQNIQGSTNEYIATNGGLITNEQGLILEETILHSNKTVNIPAGSSASDIQGLINDQPKNLNGYKLTFQFEGSRANPQEYDLGTTQLYWIGFHGGEILVQGNSAETPTNRTGFVTISSASLASNVVTVNTSSAHGLSTGDTVYLHGIGYTTTSPNGKRTSITVVDSDTFTFALTGADETYTVDSDSKMNASPPLGVKILTQNDSNDGAMWFQKCTMVFVEHLDFEHNGTATNSDILRMYYGTFGTIQYCQVSNTGTKGNDGVYYHQAHGVFAYNKVNNLDIVLTASSGSNVSMLDNNLVVVVEEQIAPNHKLKSMGGSIVTQGGSIDFDAAVSKSLIASGGVVTPQEGIIFDETILQADKTVDFDNSMSVSDMQGLINIQPKNLNGHTLTFQFAGGTPQSPAEYDFGTSSLLFNAFDSGKVVIKADDQTINADGSGLEVIIKTQNTSNNGAIKLTNISKSTVKNIQFIQNGSNIDTNVLEIEESSSGRIDNCSFQNTGTQGNDAIDIKENSCVQIEGCYFDNFARNILALDNSKVNSLFTHTYSGGTNASQANLYCETGSIITQTATQAGGGNVKQANTGGVIFDKDGALV